MRRCDQNKKCGNCEWFRKSVFSSLKSKNVKLLESGLLQRTYKKGQTIFFEGDEPKGLYCLHTGKVKIVRLGIHDHNVIVRFAVPGEILGYRALFSNESYSATAEAAEDSSICFVPKPIIDELFHRDMSLPPALLKKISEDLRASESRLLRLVGAPLRERLAELLVVLKSQYGTARRGDQEILNFRLSRREMACFLGTTTESVIRQMSRFKKEGAVKEGPWGLSINENVLHAISDIGQ